MLTKTCTSCGEEKLLEEFHIAPTGKYGRNSKCGVCKNARSRAAYAEDPIRKLQQNAEWKANNKERVAFLVSRWEKENRARCTARVANRRAQKLKATPSWIDHEEVRYIYRLAKERGLHVDHIVPLKHPLVCGLHVQDNLRCIPKELNLWKSNKLLKGVRDGI